MSFGSIDGKKVKPMRPLNAMPTLTTSRPTASDSTR